MSFSDTYTQCEKDVLPGAANGSLVYLDHARLGGPHTTLFDSTHSVDKVGGQCNNWTVVPAWGGAWRCSYIPPPGTFYEGLIIWITETLSSTKVNTVGPLVGVLNLHCLYNLQSVLKVLSVSE